MSGRKVLWLGSVAALALMLIAGCSLMPREGTGSEDGWYIQLQVQAPAASKGITVTDFNVTGLNIQVRDPAGEVLQAIDWAAAEGTQTYLVAVTQQGEHQIEVTHFGERNGELVQATERAAFNIQAMKITVIDVVPGCIGVIHVTPGQTEEPQDGTITGRLTGAGAFNGLDGGFIVLPHEAEITPENALGFGSLLIIDGMAEGVVKESGDAVDPIIFSGGQLYDVYAYIDLGGDDFPTKGDSWAGPMVVEVDGDKVVDFSYPEDFSEIVVEFPFLWQLWGTWVNEDYDEIPAGGPPPKLIMYESGLLVVYDDLSETDPIPFITLQFELTGDWTDGQEHWFQIVEYIEEGVVFAYATIRLSNGGDTLEGWFNPTDYPDPAGLEPSAENYTVYYRQE